MRLVASFAFVCVVSRLVEALHSLVNHGTKYKTVNGAYVSFVLRERWMQRKLKTYLRWLQTMVGILDQMGNPKAIAHELGLDLKLHPYYLRHLEIARSPRQMWSLVDSIVYRLDPTIQCKSYGRNRREHLKVIVFRDSCWARPVITKKQSCYPTVHNKSN